MDGFIKTVNDLPLIVKVILCIPCIDIFYSVCRVVNGLAKGNILWIVLGILTIVPGAFFMWIVDVIWVLWKGHAFLLGEDLLG